MLTGKQVGRIRRALFVPWKSRWNSWVRSITALFGCVALSVTGCGSGLGSVFSGEAGFGNFVNGAGLFLPRPIAGEDGQDGLDGANGVDGAAGLDGVAGDRGPQGEPGVPGGHGQQGEQGPRGQQGEPGNPEECGCVEFCHYHEIVDDPGNPHDAITGPAIPCDDG